jgi:hypothetical protein
MKYLFFLLLLFISCEKYQKHTYVCEYLRIDTSTGDTLINIPLDSMQGRDGTEDDIKAWIIKEENTHLLVCPETKDTIWIENQVHCMKLTCPKY